VLLFINSLLIFSGINACFAGIFYGSHGKLHDKIMSSACESKLADFVMFVA